MTTYVWSLYSSLKESKTNKNWRMDFWRFLYLNWRTLHIKNVLNPDRFSIAPYLQNQTKTTVNNSLHSRPPPFPMQQPFHTLFMLMHWLRPRYKCDSNISHFRYTHAVSLMALFQQFAKLKWIQLFSQLWRLWGHAKFKRKFHVKCVCSCLCMVKIKKVLAKHWVSHLLWVFLMWFYLNCI